MTTKLTTGAVMDLMSKKSSDVFSPLVQILDFKRLEKPGTAVRFRLILSDGTHSMSIALLGTQMNDRMEAVTKNSVVKLNKFQINNLDNGKIILMVLDFDLVTPGDGLTIIGQPSKVSADETAQCAANAANPPPSSAPLAANTGMNAVKRPPAGDGMGQPMSKGPRTSVGGSKPSIMMLADITPYQSRWTVKVQVISKSGIRTFSNARGEGKYFNMVLADESGMEIKCTTWKQDCDQFFELFELDKIYYITKGQLKTANRKFTSVNNDYEMSLTSDTQVELCTEAGTAMPGIKFNFVPISELGNIAADSLADVIGVAREVNEVTTIVGKQSQREIMKRDIVMVDKSLCSIRVTLWGEEARTFPGDDGSAPVLAMKGAKVSDWGGRSLSCSGSTMLRVNSPDIPEGTELRGWYDTTGAHQEFQAFSGQGGDGGSGMMDPWKNLSHVRTERLGLGDKADYFRVLAVVAFCKKDNCLYRACPSEKCNKKVVDLGNGSYRCEKCQTEFTEFKWRLILNISLLDSTGGQWVSCFQEAAQKVLGGYSAQQLGTLKSDDELQFDAIFEAAQYKEYEFKLRAKSETYNDETRVKLVCMELKEVDETAVNSRLLEDMDRLKVA